MAKAAKPSYQHTSSAVQVSSRQVQNSQKSGKRKRISQQSGEYIDPRGSKRGAMRPNMRMTKDRWKNIISAIANGRTRREAAKIAGLTVQSIDAYLISNVAAYKQLRDAMLVWNRRSWDTDLVDRILNDLAMGMTLKGAAIHNGLTVKRLHSLYVLVRKDKQIREAYDVARELQAESFLDEIIEIADDSGRDRMADGKINREAVNRSKLKIDTRRFAMGAMMKRRFGESKHIEVEGSVTMNHIAMLTGARKRLEKLRPDTEPMKVPVTIDNVTGEVQAE